MSERLELDLEADQPLDGTDMPVGEWDDDLLEDFPADDPASLASVPPVPTGRGQAANEKAPAGTTTASTAGAPRRHRGGPGKGAGLGTALLLCSLMLLSGLAVGLGVLTAMGGTYDILLDFRGFHDVATISDFQSYPANAFWLAVAVTLLAGLLAAIGIQRRLRGLQAAFRAQGIVLEAVRHLDPDHPESWRHEALLADADLAATTGNLLGHYHLQQAKLTRYVGLEGELHRLEKAIADDSQVDLQGNWEDPSAGSLADQALRMMVARDEALRAAAAQQETFAEQGPDLVAGLRDARRWQGVTVEQIQHHGAALERLTRKLTTLTTALPAEGEEEHRFARLVQAVTAVRDTIASLPARNAAHQDSPKLSALIERISRLGFQIAMEVARLGTKGERLLPLTQDLEDVITEFRTLADSSQQATAAEKPLEQVLVALRGRLGELDPDVLKTMVPADLPHLLAELAPIAGETSHGLSQLTKSFGLQTARLQQLRETMAQVTGLPLDDGGDPMSVPGSGMLIERCDPFASGKLPDGGLVADPFASSGGSIFEDPAASASDFTRAVLPGEEDRLTSFQGLEPAAMVLPDAPDLSGPADPVAAPESAAPRQVPAPAGELVLTSLQGIAELPQQPALSPADEKVYDLREFDAQLLPTGSGDADVDAAVHDLLEFDAVRIA
jgi:hypothetical protein